jgi:hypothetical protein
MNLTKRRREAVIRAIDSALTLCAAFAAVVFALAGYYAWAALMALSFGINLWHALGPRRSSWWSVR